MSELTAFLLARVAEDEAVARAADALGQVADKIATSTCDEFAEHIARHHPVRVLAECEAKRRIVVAATRNDEPTEMYLSLLTLEWALSALALPYADHPDYDDAWRP